MGVFFKMRIGQLHQYFLESKGVSTDTRDLKENSMFFALKGKQFNGNEYAHEALNKGASYAIIDERKFHTSTKTILVDDVLQTLQQLANFHRGQLKCPVIGITGSNGKTTTKELINEVLSKQFKVCCTRGNLNNHIGVPLTILSADLETEILIVEMGANHQGEIKILSELADVNFGIITNIGKAHLEGFGSFQGVISAKKELYDFIEQKRGTIFINKNDKLLISISRHLICIEYDDEVYNNESAFAAVQFNGLNIQSKLIGNYNCSNINAACAIGHYFGVEILDIKQAIEEYAPSNNRSQFILTDQNNSLILDAYNANPSSMMESITSFYTIVKDKKLIILGDMLELGEESKLEHQKICDWMVKNSSDAILVGAEFEKCIHPFKQFKDVDECAQWLTQESIKNTLILLKGSRTIRLEKLRPLL